MMFQQCPHKKKTNMTQHTMGLLMDLFLSTIMLFSISGTQKSGFWEFTFIQIQDIWHDNWGRLVSTCYPWPPGLMAADVAEWLLSKRWVGLEALFWMSGQQALTKALFLARQLGVVGWLAIIFELTGKIWIYQHVAFKTFWCVFLGGIRKFQWFTSFAVYVTLGIHTLP